MTRLIRPVAPIVPRFMMPLYRRFLPELRSFHSAREQVAATREAYRDSLWKRDVVLKGMLLALPVGYGMFRLIVLASGVFKYRVGAPFDKLLVFLTMTCVSLFVLTPLVLTWLGPRLRRSLRSQLIRQEKVVCPECGYDLRGQAVSRYCECGTPSESIEGCPSASPATERSY